MDFTVNQQKAIDEHGTNILVSAAAGSGKTAVLVKRIETEILRKEDPYDIDRILVMTFTQAAATEMKERILASINENIAKGTGGRRLIRQAALVSNAHISTIHGFCLDVIRNHFHIVDLSPDFRTMDEIEAKLLKADIIEEILEETYEAGKESFFKMTEHIATGKSDQELSELIIKLHDFAVSNPDVEAWFDTCNRFYSEVTEDNLYDNPLIAEYYAGLKDRIKHLLNIANRALEICECEHGPYMYMDAITDDINCLTRAVNSPDFPHFIGILRDYKATSLSAKRDNEVDKELRAKAQALRSYVKDGIGYVAGLSDDSTEDIVYKIKECADDVSELIDITRKFYNRFREKKKSKNLIDFNDMEHYCLKILTGSEVVASEYRKYFREIYIDEYQDSNMVQEAIVNSIADNNVFLVGDVKQSIYSFRMARPELFMSKYKRYDKGDGGIKIDLSDNFRSRREVTEAVNEVFSEIMHKEIGEIEYDESARLNYGADYYDEAEGAANADKMGEKLNNTPTNQNGQSIYKAEFLAIVKDKEVDSKELEALMVADKIKQLIESQMPVYDKKTKALRSVKYSDIAILLRSQKGWSDKFCKVIEGKGIPIHATSTTGYFDAPEIVNLIELLKIIDNPLQDIPLVAVMKSPLFNFTDEELAIIRSITPKGSFYKALLMYVQNTEGTLSCRVSDFIKRLMYFKEKSSYTSVYELLLELVDGDYGRIVMASSSGEKRYMNLNILLDKALEYGNTSYKGLFQFVRYIEYLKKNEIDYGEAGTDNEGDNSVRVLSIHKSKGLEFPVVFICGMSKKFNYKDSQAAILLDRDYGIGLHCINSEKRTKYKTLIKSALAEKKHMDTLSEEMRVFYVAMTRAREKIIMTGTVSDPIKDLNKSVIISQASSFLDFLIYARGEKEIFENIDFSITHVTDLVDSEVINEISNESSRDFLIKKIEKYNNDDSKISNSYAERINYSYNYDVTDSFAKVSVTELKKRSMSVVLEPDGDEEKGPDAINIEEEKVIPLIPDFLKKEDTITPPTFFGTAFHRFLEIWDYSLESTYENVEMYFNRVKTDKMMEADMLEVVRPSDIYDFLCSDIASRMRKASNAGLLKREQPFVILDQSGMLVQGIIDAYFIEDDEIVLVDYKTDVVNSGEELVSKYHVQLDYYAKALKMLIKLPVKEKVIYSRLLKESVIIP